jgi:predicted nucleic acid-binding protein
MGEAGQPLIVVSNTSPVTNLAAVGHFGLLQFGQMWF